MDKSSGASSWSHAQEGFKDAAQHSGVLGGLGGARAVPATAIAIAEAAGIDLTKSSELLLGLGFLGSLFGATGVFKQEKQ